MPGQGEPDRNASPTVAASARPRWTAPTVEVFDLADKVKGHGGGSTDNVGYTTPS